ncbi:hypothetical protein [Siphonobacter aquaeclarae]|jgi:hypothetical protein|uniref:Uncharacterized protein n=1 Tax=Siphonobacter aquaeclarae TaxID=563176 RepID=A0A1G9UAA6_9BACT|nr:hypothetical protein [Siphonobacter aquaeclarae]MBO9636614.1 hypothetical protein [Siphonobacter aquaeclarae]SDM56869.1 hypothetical protein SAMN04488090_3743 [Siphonobacter aquaeclarae]
MHYQFVDPEREALHNEYFEISFPGDDAPARSLFFISNEENLEEVAAYIVGKYVGNEPEWTLIPHRKRHG